MTYEDAIKKQMINDRGIIQRAGGYEVSCMINRHRYYLGHYSNHYQAWDVLYNFRVAYLEDQIETAGYNISDGEVINDNYILFQPNTVFTLYGKKLAINQNQYGVNYVRINETTKRLP